MSIIKSLSVGDGDMYYIRHDNECFTMVDCCLSYENRNGIVKELKAESDSSVITRFISTHPDEDHIQGMEILDDEMPLRNFYCVDNEATKPDPSDSFKKYCSLRDGDATYFVSKGCKRRWLNDKSDERGGSGLHFLWPVTGNSDYKDALKNANDGVSFNNMSLIVQYNPANNARFLWLGDLETDFMEKIEADIDLPAVHVVFAPHHGRKTGKIPNSWLEKLVPEIIVIGEAPSRHLHYYTGYNTITQNGAGDITFDCDDENRIHIYSSNPDYTADFLTDLSQDKYDHYIGTLVI